MSSKRPLVWIAVILLCVAAGAGGWFWLSQSSAPAEPPQPKTALLLKVVREGSDFRVSWNAKSPVVQAAPGATLSVEDGYFKKDLALDKEQLHTASLLYTPSTDDVSFSLKVPRAGQEPAVETVRLLSDKAPSPGAAR